MPRHAASKMEKEESKMNKQGPGQLIFTIYRGQGGKRKGDGTK